MYSLAKQMYYDQRKFFVTIILYVLLTSLISFYILGNIAYIAYVLNIYIGFIIVYTLYKWRDKYYQMPLVMKGFYTVFIFGSIISIWIILTLFQNFLLFLDFNTTTIYGLFWIQAYAILFFIIKSQFEYKPLFRSDFKSENGFRYGYLPTWMMFTLGAIFYSFFNAFIDQKSLNPFYSSIIAILFALPVLVILNELFWEPKSGVAIQIKKRKTVYNNPDITTAHGILQAYDTGLMHVEEYFERLMKIKKELLNADDATKFEIVAHVIDTCKFLGTQAKYGKILLLTFLPNLLKRWTIFALLPKHLQKISHDFLETLLLIGEADDRWLEIIEHEYKRRVSAKIRFAVFLSTEMRPRKGMQNWNLIWEGKLYRGAKGFELARQKYQTQDVQRMELNEWEAELEEAALKVMRVFFGVGSRKAWGGSIEKGSYNLHTFIALGNRLRDYDSSINIPSPKNTVLPPIEIEKPKKVMDPNYIETYLETGQFPKTEKRVVIQDAKKIQKKYLSEQKRHILVVLVISLLTILLSRIIAYSREIGGFLIFLYVILEGLPERDSAVKKIADLQFSQPDETASTTFSKMYEETLGNTFLISFGLLSIFLIAIL